MATSPKAVYWDSCVFIGLIAKEPDKLSACRQVEIAAKSGKIAIYTSTLTWAEVFKKKGPELDGPDAEDKIAGYFKHEFITPVMLSRDVGEHARKLLWKHPQLKKPSDAVHLASALRASVSELHTFDGANLLALDGKVLKSDGMPLKICLPHIELPPAPLLENSVHGNW